MSDLKELKEVINFGIAFGMAVDKALKDGWQMTDLFAIVPPLVKLPEAIKGAGDIPEILKNLTEEDKVELAAEIAKFELDSEMTEAIIEKALLLAVNISEFVFMLAASKKVK